MKLGVAISKTVRELALEDALDVDYIVYYGQIGPKYVHELVAHKPLLLHDLPEPFWLNYENPFTDEVVQVGNELLAAIQPPWFSVGVGASAEPQAHRDGPYREGDPDKLQSRETVVANIIKHTKRLCDWVKMPVLLENFNYHPTKAYEYICEPEQYTQLLEATGCGMLLDLAHARISAVNMKWESEQVYLSALPLDKVREIHFTRPGWQGSERVDLHQPVQQDDLDVLAWVLERTPTEAVTLEVGDLPRDVLVDQLALMRRFLAG
jgi:uncharacterized protein (UPF0276 family)